MLLTTGGAAIRLGISRERVHDFIADGRLTAIRDSSGRFLLRAEDVDEFYAKRQRAAQQRRAATTSIVRENAHEG